MMTKLREIRLQVVTIINKFEAYLIPAGKFIMAMIVFCTINTTFGYMKNIAKFPIALILGLFLLVHANEHDSYYRSTSDPGTRLCDID